MAPEKRRLAWDETGRDILEILKRLYPPCSRIYHTLLSRKKIEHAVRISRPGITEKPSKCREMHPAARFSLLQGFRISEQLHIYAPDFQLRGERAQSG